MSPSTPYVQPGEPLNELLRSFWQRQVDAAEQETPDYRHPPLPLARIKKVMKSDPDVKVSRPLLYPPRLADTQTQMIAADAPILFCKACESATHLFSLGKMIFILTNNAVFIAEITARAFIIADSNKRRTLSRADIAKALAKSDQFDFLIDIVPREDGIAGLAHQHQHQGHQHHLSSGSTGSVGAGGSGSGGGNEGGSNPVAGVRLLSWNTAYTCC